MSPGADVAIQLAAVGWLRGTVHGDHGPSKLFSVRIDGPTTDTRPFTDGTFEFPRLDPGDYTIDVTSSDGNGRAKAHVADGVASVDIALVANATVTGRLVDKAHKPVPGLSVTLAPDLPPEQFHILLQDLPPSSGPDGRFRVDGGWEDDARRARPPTNAESRAHPRAWAHDGCRRRDRQRAVARIGQRFPPPSAALMRTGLAWWRDAGRNRLRN